MEKIKLSRAVIVEGRYDKSKLSEILDAFIIETNGFQIFKDKKRLAFIKRLAAEQGIILLTDSDSAGFMIRRFVAAGIPKEQVLHLYIPDIYGKEKRKSAPSKEGKLGVEGMSREILLSCLEKAQVMSELTERTDPVTSYDLYELGVMGKPGAQQKKKALLKALNLPEFLSTNSLISYLNHTMTRTEFFAFIEKGAE